MDITPIGVWGCCLFYRRRIFEVEARCIGGTSSSQGLSMARRYLCRRRILRLCSGSRDYYGRRREFGLKSISVVAKLIAGGGRICAHLGRFNFPRLDIFIVPGNRRGLRMTGFHALNVFVFI